MPDDTTNDQAKPVWTCNCTDDGRAPEIQENGEVRFWLSNLTDEHLNEYARMVADAFNTTNSAAKPKPFYVKGLDLYTPSEEWVGGYGTTIEATRRRDVINTSLNLTVDEPEPQPEQWVDAPEGASIELHYGHKDGSFTVELSRISSVSPPPSNHGKCSGHIHFTDGNGQICKETPAEIIALGWKARAEYEPVCDHQWRQLDNGMVYTATNPPQYDFHCIKCDAAKVDFALSPHPDSLSGIRTRLAQLEEKLQNIPDTRPLFANAMGIEAELEIIKERLAGLEAENKRLTQRIGSIERQPEPASDTIGRDAALGSLKMAADRIEKEGYSTTARIIREQAAVLYE